MENKSKKRNQKDLIIMSILEFGDVPPNTNKELLREIYQEEQTKYHSFKNMYDASKNAYFRTVYQQSQEVLSKINYKGEAI
jgi:hypothetical protein